MRRLALLLAAPLFLAACSAASAPTAAAPRPGGVGGATAQGVDSAQVGSAPAGAPAPKEGIPNPVAFNADRNLILTANISMRAKDPWATSEKAQLIVASLGGDVLSLSESGSSENKTATLTVRVPSRSFGEALRQFRSLDGEVVTSNVTGQDVTDQFVDLQARLAAKQSEEQRYLALLARANTIDEILKVDASITNVRTQVEQLTGQINSLKSRTDFSTLVLSVTPIPAIATPVEEPGKAWDPANTFARALATLGAMLRVFADFAIWIMVFGAIPLIILGVGLAATRTRRPPAPTAPTA